MISIIVSTFNEEKKIGKVIDEIKDFAPKDSQIMVIDSLSNDKTLKIAKEKGAEIYQLYKRGKGFAVRFGAKKAKGDILVFIDGDASYSPSNFKNLIKEISEKDQDIAYGSRFLPDSQREMNFFRYFGNRLFFRIGEMLYERKPDFLTGFFAIKKDKFFELCLSGKGFEIETEIFVKAIKKGLKMSEIPICYEKNGDSKLNPIKDGFKILIMLFKNYVKT